MPSLLARLVQSWVRISRKAGCPRDQVSLRRMLDKARRAPVAEPSAAIKRKLDVSFEMQDGFRVYTIKPRIHASAGHLFYIHGGASVFEIAPHHWSFVARMVERLGVACTVPLYPLAPEHDCIKALAFMTRVYRKLTATHDPAGLVIMGDSAGAGFGMSLAIQAKAEGLPLPGGLVLISPSLDPTMSHPSQEEIEKCDPLLDRQIARIYASCW